MAAFCAVRNRKNQKLRDGFNDFLARCLEKSEGKNKVELCFVLDTLNTNDIKIEEKELNKLKGLADKNGTISRYKFTIPKCKDNYYHTKGRTFHSLLREVRLLRV